MDERKECRVAALRLAIQYFHDRNVSDTDIELQADKFYNYITTGRLTRGRY
jgi:hypothetical protein